MKGNGLGYLQIVSTVTATLLLSLAICLHLRPCIPLNIESIIPISHWPLSAICFLRLRLMRNAPKTISKPSLSAEHSGVRSALVKTYRGKVSPVQTTVLGNSLKPGVFPKMWKVRVFVFVYKSGDRSGVSYYFPSSYSLCKTFEMVVHNPLHSFLGVYLYPLSTASLLI